MVISRYQESEEKGQRFIQEVAIVREYDGAVEKFVTQGQTLVERRALEGEMHYLQKMIDEAPGDAKLEVLEICILFAKTICFTYHMSSWWLIILVPRDTAIETQEERKTLKRKAIKSPPQKKNQKAIAGCEKKIAKIDESIEKMHKSLKKQRHMLDAEREVCFAFVICNQEHIKWGRILEVKDVRNNNNV
jgi:hypothetical protein